MRSRLSFIKLSFVNALAYRSEVILWLILDSLPMVVLLFVWSHIYQGKINLGDYNLQSILQYYFLVTVINGISTTHFESWRVREIRDGKIDSHLTKPLGYLLRILLQDVGGKLFYLSFSLPFFILLHLALSHTLHLDLATVPLHLVPLFALLIIFAYLIEFLLGLLVVLIGFWFEYSEGLEHLKWVSVSLFSGIMIPLQLMPEWLRNASLKLPFRYMYAVPLDIVQQRSSLGWQDAVNILAFLGMLLALVLFTWKKAVYKYSSPGG